MYSCDLISNYVVPPEREALIDLYIQVKSNFSGSLFDDGDLPKYLLGCFSFLIFTIIFI